MHCRVDEGLRYEELRGLVSSKLSIDQYTPKIGSAEETVVVAFTVTYQEPAQDLRDFIETSDLEHMDIEASSTPEPDGSFRVFVEFTRDVALYRKIKLMLDAINQVVGLEKNWRYVAFRQQGEVHKFTEENFNNDVLTTKTEYLEKYGSE